MSGNKGRKENAPVVKKPVSSEVLLRITASSGKTQPRLRLASLFSVSWGCGIHLSRGRAFLRVPSTGAPISERAEGEAGSQATESIHPFTPDRTLGPAVLPTLPSLPMTASRLEAGQSLWNRAYEALRDNDAQLVERYEKLLSMELPESTTSTAAPQGTSSQVERLSLAKNRINTDPDTRQDQLKKITDRGMERADGKQTKCTIFGHEYNLTRQVSQAAQFIKAVKGLVDEAVKVSPEASLAWAGVCVLLPVLTNPVAAEEASRDRLFYITSRIHYYVELESLLWPENLESKDLRREFEYHIVDLYQHILEFQITAVLRFYQSWVTKFSRDVLSRDDWKGMVSKIERLEQDVRAESITVNTIASRNRLGDIHRAAEEQGDNLCAFVSVAKEQLDDIRFRATFIPFMKRAMTVLMSSIV
ncbi:hypothetical protein F5883DRAFT_651801 [Diaporthe sp. PMI_573]|nr:hypothetical protein F5883DRAFT_651801 [Diaporthaceae sp. PMI_573]